MILGTFGMPPSAALKSCSARVSRDGFPGTGFQGRTISILMPKHKLTLFIIAYALSTCCLRSRIVHRPLQLAQRMDRAPV